MSKEETELLTNISICIPLSWKDGKFGIRIAQALSERGARVFAFAASSAEAMDFAAKVNKATNRQGVVGLRCDQLKSLNVAYNAVITDGSFYIPDGNFKGGNKGGLFNNLERLIKVEKENRRLIDENSRLRNSIFDQQEQLKDKNTKHAQKDAASEQAMNNFYALEHVSNAGKTERAEDFSRLQKEKEEWEEKCRRLHDVLLQEESAKMDRALVDAKDAQARKRQVERIFTCPGPTVSPIKEEELTPGGYEVNRKDPEQAPEVPEDGVTGTVVLQQQQHVQVQVACQPFQRHTHPPNVLSARLPFPRCSPVPQTCLDSSPNLPQGRPSPLATPRAVICRSKPSLLTQNRIVRSISCTAEPQRNNEAVLSVNAVNVAQCAPGPRFQRSPLGVSRDTLSHHASWATLPGQNACANSSTAAPTQTQLPVFSPSPRLLNAKLPIMVPWAWPQA